MSVARHHAIYTDKLHCPFFALLDCDSPLALQFLLMSQRPYPSASRYLCSHSLSLDLYKELSNCMDSCSSMKQAWHPHPIAAL